MCNAADNRIALVGIIVENNEKVEAINALLSEYADFIIGRMGLPYRNRNMNIISVVMDAPNDQISALSGKLGMLDGISVKTVYSKAEG